MACTSCGGCKTTTPSRGTSSCSCSSGGAVQWPCTQGFEGGLERARFYDGMVLTQSDLYTEQAFWQSKRQLTNRALGEGVVWGLRAAWDGRSQNFTLAPGYALDCCGRDLVVTECQVVSGRSLVDRSNPVVQGILASAGKGESAKAYLALKYSEVMEGLREVSAQGCTPSGRKRSEPARVRETASLCLVPIPEPGAPGPVTQFLQEFKELVASVDPKLAEELQPDSGIDSGPPFELRVRCADQERVVRPTWDEEKKAWDLQGEPLAFVSTVQAPEEIVVELRALHGWVLSEGELRLNRRRAGEESSALYSAQVSAPWQLVLALPVPGPSSLNEGTEQLTYSGDAEMVLSRLFSERSLQAQDIDLQIELQYGRPDGEQRPQLQVSLRAKGQLLHLSEAPSAQGSECAEGLGPGLFFADAGSDLRPVVLGALYSWFSASLKTRERQEIWDGSRIAAGWTMLVAWRLLFGVDAVLSKGKQDTRLELAKLLQTLIQRWCQGLHYGGPRCQTEHQAVTLGTVSLSASGRVSSLDMWAGRRQVITGPLLNHWMGQVGLAPLDVVVSRVAGAICCVAGQGLQALPELAQGFQESAASAEYTSALTELGAIAFSGTSGALVGEESVIAKRLYQLQIKVVERREVSSFRFLQLAARALSVEEQNASGLCTLVLIKGQGGRRHYLLLPADAQTVAAYQAGHARLKEEIQARMATGVADSLGELGQAPYADLAFVLAMDMALPGEESPEAVAAFGSLERAGMPSLGAAIALGPEGLWRALEARRTSLPAEQFNKLWSLCMERLTVLLKGQTEAIQKVIGKGNFMRSDLLLDKLPEALVTVYSTGEGPWLILPDAQDACSEAHEMGG